MLEDDAVDIIIDIVRILIADLHFDKVPSVKRNIDTFNREVNLKLHPEGLNTHAEGRERGHQVTVGEQSAPLLIELLTTPLRSDGNCHKLVGRVESILVALRVPVGHQVQEEVQARRRGALDNGLDGEKILILYIKIIAHAS